MKFWRVFFQCCYLGGFAAIVVLFLDVEWETLHTDWSRALKPLVHLGVILAFLLKPLFWVLLTIVLGGHFGEWHTGDEE